jgi:hypothetical protein
VVLPLGPSGGGEKRLEFAGIKIVESDGKVVIDDVIQADEQGKDTAAKTAKLEFDMVIQSAEAPRERMPKQIFYIPAIVLLGLIWMLQRRRRTERLAQRSAA